MGGVNLHGLTENQLKFCNEYMVDLNAAEAAMRAGYSEDVAEQEGVGHLSKPVIQNYIAELQQLAQARTAITVDRVLAEYAKIAFFDVRKVFGADGQLLRVGDLDDDTAGAVAAIECYEEQHSGGDAAGGASGVVRKVKVADKIRALDSLGKYLGVFKADNGQRATFIVNIR